MERKKMKKQLLNLLPVVLILSIILTLFLFSGCENYNSSEELNMLFGENDLNIEFKVLEDKDHKYEFTISPDGAENKDYLLIDVENNFSASSDRTSITPEKVYKLSVTIKNESADPLVLYSFWEDFLKETRNFTLAGENGNPPNSETQSINEDWVTYEETFKVQENEKFFMIRICSNEGVFSIKSISIEEINDI